MGEYNINMFVLTEPEKEKNALYCRNKQTNNKQTQLIWIGFQYARLHRVRQRSLSLIGINSLYTLVYTFPTPQDFQHKT